ncbi:MAG: hypothetical protein JM58_14715 [Peptococcaceae bacterium BICA1-8]|nr:MAG: hypothetical protein JM58_14715 [Peptococcaceae bacterium BICA1-8]
MQMTTCLTNTKKSLLVRFRRVCRGQRTWHVWREVLGTWDLRSPAGSSKLAGREVQSKKRLTEDLQEVGLTHSTPRSGEPATWGRG